MDFDPACIDFLDHFDRPKTADEDQSELVAGFVCDQQGRIVYPEQESRTDHTEPIRVAHSDPPVDWDLIDALPDRPTYTRGIGWVLLWTGTLAVLAIVISMLVQVGYRIAAAHSLTVAARAGAMEATLPRSSYRSVVATVQRRLENQPLVAEHLTMTMLQNGTPVIDSFRIHEGDEFSIALSIPATYAIPDWVEKLSIFQDGYNINAEAACRLPGRKLPPHTH